MMTGRVFRDTSTNCWCIEMGRKQYLTNTLQIVEFTGYAQSFPDKQIPKAGEVGSIWYTTELLAQGALATYTASLKPIEEPVWVNI